MTSLNKERELFEEAYLSVGGKQRELELEDGEYTNSKSQLGWELWQIKAKAQTVPEWISVKDSMPEEGTEVLVHGFGQIAQATKDKQFAGGFKQRNCYGWEAVYHATHWMPKNFKLPETFCMYYTDEHPYKETLASESGAEG